MKNLIKGMAGLLLLTISTGTVLADSTQRDEALRFFGSEHVRHQACSPLGVSEKIADIGEVNERSSAIENALFRAGVHLTNATKSRRGSTKRKRCEALTRLRSELSTVSTSIRALKRIPSKEKLHDNYRFLEKITFRHANELAFSCRRLSEKKIIKAANHIMSLTEQYKKVLVKENYDGKYGVRSLSSKVTGQLKSYLKKCQSEWASRGEACEERTQDDAPDWYNKPTTNDRTEYPAYYKPGYDFGSNSISK